MTTPAIDAGSPGQKPKPEPTPQQQVDKVRQETPIPGKVKTTPRPQRAPTQKEFDTRKAQQAQTGARSVEASKVEEKGFRDRLGDFAGKAQTRNQQFRGVVTDTLKEGLTLAQADTRTYNKDDLIKQHGELRDRLALHYTAQRQKLEEDGLEVTESQKEWVDSIVGDDANAFAEGIISAQPRLRDLAKELGKNSVPVYGTVRTWKDSSNWTRAAGVASDLLFILPVAGTMGSAVRSGRGLANATARTTVLTLTAPISVVRRPGAVARGTVRDIAGRIENVVDPKKVPIDALELQSYTVRIPLSKFDSPLTATRARDVLSKQAIGGERAAVELGGTAVNLPRTALQRTTPSAIHATPDIRPYLNGAVVREGREGGLFFAPNLHSRFTTSSAFGDLPAGNIPGAVVVTDPKILTALKSTGKIFDDTVEIETKLLKGFKIPPPSQVLFTRRIDGTKIPLLIIGKPLSPAQVARLKIVGATDSLANIFKPRFSARRVQASNKYVELGKEAQDLLRRSKLERSKGNTRVANELRRRADRIIASLDDQARIAGGASIKAGTVFGTSLYHGRQDINRGLEVLSRPPKPSPKLTSPIVDFDENRPLRRDPVSSSPIRRRSPDPDRTRTVRTPVPDTPVRTTPPPDKPGAVKVKRPVRFATIERPMSRRMQGRFIRSVEFVTGNVNGNNVVRRVDLDTGRDTVTTRPGKPTTIAESFRAVSFDPTPPKRRTINLGAFKLDVSEEKVTVRDSRANARRRSVARSIRR